MVSEQHNKNKGARNYTVAAIVRSMAALLWKYFVK